MLPNDFKKCESLDLFKDSIKSWKPDNCPCELCKVYVKGLGYTVLSGFYITATICVYLNWFWAETRRGVRCSGRKPV